MIVNLKLRCTIFFGTEGVILFQGVHSNVTLRSENFVPSILPPENDVFTFVFVRHPFNRLLSAFLNKFYKMNNSMFLHMLKGKEVTFSNFINLVIDQSNQNVIKMNEHWRPLFTHCNICNKRY